MAISNPNDWQEIGRSKGDKYDKILEMIAATNQVNPDGTFTIGDILYASATDILSKLAKGTNGQFLQIGATIPAWVNSPVIGTYTINIPHTAWTRMKYSIADTSGRPGSTGGSYPKHSAWFSSTDSDVTARTMHINLSGLIPLLSGKTTTITQIDIRVNGGAVEIQETVGAYYYDWNAATGSGDGGVTPSVHGEDLVLGTSWETVSFTNSTEFTTDMVFFLVWKPSANTGYVGGAQITYTIE